MEAEIMTVTYDSVDAIMADLKAIGANVTAETLTETKVKGLTTRSMLETVRQEYEKFRCDAVLPATYEIVYGHAWKPSVSSSQDKPGQQKVYLEPR